MIVQQEQDENVFFFTFFFIYKFCIPINNHICIEIHTGILRITHNIYKRSTYIYEYIYC